MNLGRTGMTYESVFTAKCYLLLWQRRWWYYCPCEICSEPKNIFNNSNWGVAKKQKSETLVIQGGTWIMSTIEMFVSWCFLKGACLCTWIATDGLSSPNPSSESWVGWACDPLCGRFLGEKLGSGFRFDSTKELTAASLGDIEILKKRQKYKVRGRSLPYIGLILMTCLLATSHVLELVTHC